MLTQKFKTSKQQESELICYRWQLRLNCQSYHHQPLFLLIQQCIMLWSTVHTTHRHILCPISHTGPSSHSP